MKNEFLEFDIVKLIQPCPTHPEIPVNSLGTIVHVHGTGDAYEVEFTNDEGDFIGLATLKSNSLALDQRP